mmetsp:Transcript_7952/g.9073  ORF Transcript_7952/g.9073 Transcript_7952/m.9073 type:complete len:1253 (-) Transcript_7952:248-4006(-)
MSGSMNFGGSGSVETTSGSQLNDLQLSISTLEKQYAAPLGQRLVMGIQIDAKCLEGGFDAVSKRARQMQQQQHSFQGSSMQFQSSSIINNNLLRTSMTSSVGNRGGGGADESSDGMTSIDFNNNNSAADTNTNINAKGDGDDDAFAFLNDNPPSTNVPPPLSNKKGFGMGFLKKVAARTTDTLERGMQGLAVRMDQGKNADLVRVGIYDPTTNELLGVTESLPVPGTSNGDINTQQQQQQTAVQDIRFEVPLWIPGSRRQQSLLLKVWIQSGATLVLQSAKASKNYLLGSSIINCQALSEGVTAVALTTTAQKPHHQSQTRSPQLQLGILPDPKFSPILTRGWSLTDPDMSGYSSTLNYLPLDQSYVFPGKQPNHWLIAHERATESTMPLPIAAAVTNLAANACVKSLDHAKSVSRILRNNRHDYKDPMHKATCNLGVIGVVPLPNHNNGIAATAATVSLAWRRPDSMFEFEIAVNESIPVVPTNGPTPGGYVSVQRKFYPKLCSPDRGDHIIPGILQAYGGKMPSSGYLLGGVYICVMVQTTGFGGNDPTMPDGAPAIELWETVLGLEAFVNKSSPDGKSNANTIQVPLRKGKDDVGHLLLQLQVTLPEGQQQPANGNYMATLPATDGLVTLVGMDSLSDGVKPHLDSMAPAVAPSLRHQQLNTMGYFFTTQYMDQHLALRQSACDAFQERARRYKQALSQPEKDAPPHTLRTPKNFRPSSSRTTTLLSGIPFNCHICSLNINVMDAIHPKATSSSATAASEYPGASFHNITCGAPADHARGFGNILTNVSHKNVSGGLRRLETQRLECATQLQQAQSMLIAGVGKYLTEARKTGPVNHVPARHAEIQQLRWRVFECVHSLHHITWMCAVRRANVFSQSLGLALSSFLASLSDKNKCAAGWPNLWTRHGFLVCFEGLLSAAGKELGMIEDASVAIAMLRMVHIILVPDSGIPKGAVNVPSSPYLRWTNITSCGEGSARKFEVQIGIDRGYYAERIPTSLQNNASVRLYPILFEVGVDIKQAGSNLMNNNQNNQSSGVCGDGSLVVDDDEDDVGVADDDVLVALNYEAMRKMNCYAHALSPQQIPLDKVHAAMERVFYPSQSTSNLNNLDKDQLPIHPSLAALNSHIMSSVGKMNHSILDEAATIAQQLGGGGVVFCKSGKDRTAMHLTYKQCQFAARYRGNADNQAILRDAHLLRLHGTRLPICEKNVGQALYAFNRLQVKFMPEALKPPMDCLAGFLKGGEIFKGNRIES